jgi:hypothetical protein
VEATDWSRTQAQSFTYTYTAKYGSPEIDPQPLQLSDWALSADGLELTVRCANLRAGYVHEFVLPEVKSRDDATPLRRNYAAYTLSRIPVR